MAVLGSRVALAASCALAGCYAPELPDCAVTCATDDDCAPAHVCGSDRMCAAPARAGRCTERTVIDAGLPAPRPADALACTFTVTIAGRGRVVIDGLAACPHTAPDDTCVFAMASAPHDVLAIPEPGEEFEKWTSATCTGQDESCHLAQCQPQTTLAVKFVRER